MDYEIPDTTDELPVAEQNTFHGTPGGGFIAHKDAQKAIPKTVEREAATEVIEFGAPSPERVFSPRLAPPSPEEEARRSAEEQSHLLPVPVGRPSKRYASLVDEDSHPRHAVDFFLPGFGELRSNYRNVILEEGYAVLVASADDSAVYFPTGEREQGMRYEGEVYTIRPLGVRFQLDRLGICIVQLERPQKESANVNGEAGGNLP